MAKREKASTTRRTLHYYWLVTRRHFGLFALLVFSTLFFGGFQTYMNPFVMGLIVDRVSAAPVAADQVFTVFGPYILRADVQQAAGLLAVEA